MKIWVTGAEGQLGRSLQVRQDRSQDDFVWSDREVDLTDAEAVEHFMQAHRPDVILNCAAYTDVERAEAEEAAAYAVNATAVGHLAEAAKRADALLIHISTDYVFMGGCCSLLDERAKPNPLNAYGRTKLAGEEKIQQSGCHYMIFRTAWLYSEWGKNFVKTILRHSAEREELQVVDDELGSPTYAGDLADALLEILAARRFVEGVYHYTNLGECSRWEFACEICRMAQWSVKVTPCTSDAYPSRVQRPKNVVLDKRKVQERLQITIPHWRDSLAKFIRDLQA